ncbi:hypothetical protein Zm00014a_019564 [Zea mays]|uniref:Uncharacterized protein n=1 Tax=Zea mays TaxID=4577 RepID=A0A3L6EXA0_MAIZE|nr:hypothetical protein Zm00014a_019564 [Zea mays]
MTVAALQAMDALSRSGTMLRDSADGCDAAGRRLLIGAFDSSAKGVVIERSSEGWDADLLYDKERGMVQGGPVRRPALRRGCVDGLVLSVGRHVRVMVVILDAENLVCRLDRNASTSTHVAFKIWSLLCSFLLQVAITYDPSNMYQLSKLKYGHVEAQLGAAEEDRLARWLHSLCAFARLADQRLHVYRPGTRRHQEERNLNCNCCAVACSTDKHSNKAMVHVSFYRNKISSDGGTQSSWAMDDDLHEMSIAEDTDDSSIDLGAELCQQITVSQLVAAAISQDFARAEVELEMETVIAAKNFEIARLSDRVQYYEAANREMSQRNQEAIEISRLARRVLWSLIAITRLTCLLQEVKGASIL